MSYLSKLKQLESADNFNNIPQTDTSKLPKGGYGGFGSTNTGNIEKNIIDIAEAQAESRRKKVLLILAEKPDSKRAYVTDATTDPDNVILTIAIRDLATFEILVPKDKYDPFMLMELINEGIVQ